MKREAHAHLVAKFGLRIASKSVLVAGGEPVPDLRAAASKLAHMAYEAASNALVLPEDKKRIRLGYQARWRPAEQMPNRCVTVGTQDPDSSSPF